MKGELYSLLAAFTWAIALVAFKRGGEQMGPMTLNLFKNVIALTLLLLTLPFTGAVIAPFRLLTPGELGWLCASGLLGITFADTFLFASLNRLGVTRITIVDCLYSPSVIFFSWLLLHERITWSHALSAGLIISGILVSTQVRTHHYETQLSQRALWLGVLYGLVAIFSMALGIVMVKPLLERLPILWSSTLRLLVGTVSLGLWMTLTDRNALRELLSPHESWKFSIFGALMGSYLSMVFWIGGFKYAKASTAGLLNQSTIVFAIPLSALFLKEPITRPKLVAISLAASGVLLLTFRPF